MKFERSNKGFWLSFGSNRNATSLNQLVDRIFCLVLCACFVFDYSLDSIELQSRISDNTLKNTDTSKIIGQ